MFILLLAGFSILRGKSFNVGHHAPCIYRYRLNSAFRGLDLGQGSQDQQKTKPVGFMFSHTSQLIRIFFFFFFFFGCDGETRVENFGTTLE